MISNTNHYSRVRENSEVVIKFTQIPVLEKWNHMIPYIIFHDIIWHHMVILVNWKMSWSEIIFPPQRLFQKFSLTTWPPLMTDSSWFSSPRHKPWCWVPLNQFMNIHPSLICLLFYWNGQLKKSHFQIFQTHSGCGSLSPQNPPKGPKALSCFASLVASRWVPTDLWASEAGVIYPTKVEHMSMIYPNPGESQIVTWVKLYDKQLIYAGYTPDIPWPLTGWDVLPSSWTRDGNWWCHLKVGISSSFFGNFLGISWMLSEVGEAIFPIKKMVFGRKP